MAQKLVREFNPERIILFGSYAWGTPDRGGDVDLMVIVKTRDEFDFFQDVRASLEHKILKRGRVLYEHLSLPTSGGEVRQRVPCLLR